ncbi:MAG: hypothetical protein ACJ8G8_22755, partial [Pseudomonas sp.]
SACAGTLNVALAAQPINNRQINLPLNVPMTSIPSSLDAGPSQRCEGDEQVLCRVLKSLLIQ